MTIKRKILFRADAGPTIGYGHFIRSLALADMLKDDFDCVFYTQTPTDYQKKEAAAVCPLVELPATDSRLELFLDMLTGDEVVVLDNYFYTTDYQRRIKEKGCSLVCIDDMHDKHYVADVVINHGNVSSEQFSIEQYTRLCIGNEWILLRKPFLKPIKQKIREKQIIVCFGGADPLHLTDKVVSMLIQLSIDYEIVVIIGDTVNVRKDTLSRVKLYQKLSAQEMANLFETSFLGIMPVSSTYIEAVSRGLRVIAGYFVDNQKIDFQKIIDKRDFIPVYDFTKLTIQQLDSTIAKAKAFHFDIPDYSDVPSRYINLFSEL